MFPQSSWDSLSRQQLPSRRHDSYLRKILRSPVQEKIDTGALDSAKPTRDFKLGVNKSFVQIHNLQSRRNDRAEETTNFSQTYQRVVILPSVRTVEWGYHCRKQHLNVRFSNVVLCQRQPWSNTPLAKCRLESAPFCQGHSFAITQRRGSD